MALIVEDETELVGHLAASKLNRLARRTEEPVTKDALAFDEFLTAVVMLSWLTYGFRVPQTWTRGAARATLFFVERVMRVGVADVQASHEVLMQFAAARQAEARARARQGGHGGVRAVRVRPRARRFASRGGASASRGSPSPGTSPPRRTPRSCSARTSAGIGASRPGSRKGAGSARSSPSARTRGSSSRRSWMKFARFQVAFCEMCFRVEAARGGSPRERQMRAFRRAMQREDISRDAKSVDSAEKGEKDKVMRMYDPDYVPTSESETTVIERETTREVHEEKEEEENVVEDVPDVGESWVPVSKSNKFKGPRAAKAAAALGRKAPAPAPAPELELEPEPDVPDVGESWVPVSKSNKFKEAARVAKSRRRAREEGARARARARFRARARARARARPRRRPRRSPSATLSARPPSARTPSAAAWCRAARRRRRRASAPRGQEAGGGDHAAAARGEDERFFGVAERATERGGPGALLAHAGAPRGSAAQRRVGSQSHARGTGSGARFQVAEDDSTDDEAGEDEREVGTAEWRSQQERRRRALPYDGDVHGAVRR